MQTDELDRISGARSDYEDPSSTVQLSTNTRTRLEKLARWRVDPALIKFPKGSPTFEGGHAMVSKALLASSFDDTRKQLVEPSNRDFDSNSPIATSDGDSRSQEVESSNEGAVNESEGRVQGEEQESEDEISGKRKAVAVKKMNVNTKEDIIRVLGLTLREAEFLVELSHENIIKFEGFVEDLPKGMIWLIFPWEDNGNLKDFIDSHDWEVPQRISLINDVARGVGYLHERKPPICHGDLKCVNVVVNSKCRAVITNFGSARHPVTSPNKERERDHIKEAQLAPSLEAKHFPSANTITLAPELLEDDDANLASDIWALGCLAYEVMTNSIPSQDVRDAIVLERDDRGELPPIYHEAGMIFSLVKQCWNVDPSKRPTANECLRKLEWMPMILPTLSRTADTIDTASFVEHSPDLLIILEKMRRG